jgi:hypothetical protein
MASATPVVRLSIVHSTKVLLATADPRLRRQREILLSNEGCEVVSSRSRLHANHLIQAYPFDCLVLGNTLSFHSSNDLASRFRLRNRSGRVIQINAGNGHRPIDHPDASVTSNDELVKFFRAETFRPPTPSAASPALLFHPPPPGWLILHQCAQRAKSPAELIPIIDEMNKLLRDYEARHSSYEERSYATQKITRKRSG